MADWILAAIRDHGYLAVVLLMVLENVFPPVPSELIMPFAGFVASQGHLSVVGVILWGTAGSLLGTLPWYWVGRRIGRDRLRAWVDRHGHWLAVDTNDVDRAQRWFDRHGAPIVLLGRLVPGVRSVISAPAGFAAMPFGRFLAWSAVGSLAWVGLLTLAGHALGSRYELVMRWADPVSKVVIGALLLAYIWRVVRGLRRNAARSR